MIRMIQLWLAKPRLQSPWPKRPWQRYGLWSLSIAIIIATPVSIYATSNTENVSLTATAGNTEFAKPAPKSTTKPTIAPWEKFADDKSKENAENPASDNQYDEMLTRTVNAHGRSRVTSGNIWRRLRKGFGLTGYEQTRVDSELNWYANHQNYIDRLTTRATPFIYYVLQEVEKRHMPTEIALLPVVESAYQPYAYSPGQAAGLWQFIAPTADRYGLEMNWWYDGRRDVYESTQAALEFLIHLYQHFDKDWLLALAAYNSGQGTVDRAIRANKAAGKKTDFWSLDLPKETRNYVPKLLAISILVDDPRAYGVALSIIPDTPYFERVDIGGQIDLSLAATMADMSVEELYALNPAFNRWATPPDGPDFLLIPIDKAKNFKLSLAKTNLKEAIQWAQHDVQPGETLSTIAAQYQTTVAAIQQINKMDDTTILSGESLIIPMPATGRDKTNMAAMTNGTKIEYTVAQGDTFWDIAQKYDVTVKRITEWNSLSPDDLLIPGQQLTIWHYDVTADKYSTKLLKTRLTKPPTRSTTRKLSYQVRRGESLAHISKKFRVTVDKLKEWNSLQSGEPIQPGQYLTVFVDVTRFSEKI